MKRVIVESMSGYREAVKYIASNESVIWYTTSSEVFSRLSNSDCHVENLEEWITEEYFNSIGIDSYNISNSLTSILEDYYKWDKGYIKQVFGWSIQNLSNVVLYKTVLLDRVVGSSIDSEVLCVGLKSLTPIDNLKLNIERFDTIFSVLAFNINNPKLGIISHNEDKNKLHKLSDYVKHRKMGFYEKTLSILNNTASSFMYKIWRSFYSKTGLFKTVSLSPFPKRNVFVHKDCEFIEESFIKEMINGCSFSKLQPLPRVAHKNVDRHSDPLIKRRMLEAYKKSVNASIEYSDIIEAGGLMVVNRVLEVANTLRRNQKHLDENFSETLISFGSKGELRSNFFTHPIEQMFAIYCRKKGIPITFYEHGITLGLSRWTKYPAQFWGMQLADVGVYHCIHSINQLQPWIKNQKTIIRGLPITTRKINFIFLQNFLTRKWLNLPSNKQVVVYVADLERNNYIYGPYQENDYQFFSTTKAILLDLSKRYCDHIILLKLYPTHRYPESVKFTDLIKEIPNLKVVKDMDFRYLRSAVNVIALSSSQSTLGWVLGSNANVVFYEKKANPSNLSGEILTADVDGVSRVFNLNKESVCA